ncbi:nuclear transport factor 2 family protein [bacterium]|nr:nuclear transport factor 2 family protein [bacterium]
MKRLFIASLLVIVACQQTDQKLAMQVRMLTDQNAIMDVINDLFVSTDNRDWSKVQSCFADTVLFDMTSLTGGEPTRLTPQQITGGWETGLKDLKAIHHQAGNYKIAVTGNEADAFCYGIASHYFPNPTDRNTRTFVGSYNFHLRKIGETWRIDRFKFNLKYLDGNLNLTSNK